MIKWLVLLLSENPHNSHLIVCDTFVEDDSITCPIPLNQCNLNMYIVEEMKHIIEQSLPVLRTLVICPMRNSAVCRKPRLEQCEAAETPFYFLAGHNINFVLNINICFPYKMIYSWDNFPPKIWSLLRNCWSIWKRLRYIEASSDIFLLEQF